ncbi:unnamed protein product, partial [Allacma fusca]
QKKETLLQDVKVSCTIKLSNFLDPAITDPQYYIWSGAKDAGPLTVPGNFSEVFSFSGDSKAYERLLDTLYENSPVPDLWCPSLMSDVPIELFVTHGNFLMRGHMTNGPRSIVHVEILEFNPIFGSPSSVFGGKQRIVDGKSLESIRSTISLGANSKSVRNIGRFSCIVEIVNCLSIPLRNQSIWYCNSENNNFLPLGILPLHRESFLGSDETIFEAIFSYEIMSTDLALVIALKVGSGCKSFAATFVPIPAITEKKELEELMNRNDWKTHDYKIYSNTSEGAQLISIRNIRVAIRMTEEKKPVLKVRIFAI